MASESSFDVVSSVARQEVDNALNQAAKEIAQRFDFRGTDAAIRWSGELGIHVEASSQERAEAALDVFKDKLVKRKVSLKALDTSDGVVSGKMWTISSTLQDGLTSEQAKKVSKVIRDEAPKGVRAQIQGDEVRVSSKKRDDLQEVMATLREQDFDFAVQFTNRR